ncbi:MAG: molecular chaperone Hsp20 [Flavobacterium sp. MedPE-SWcel]|uniref:Hsp20/alpha crystallin family protein n=1 Tax=uncultured Flavobacterium sp. TaxID=165435 RepID=UPI00090FA848|nr:Hsp20/alpha crystallin family protein [uncultured Flavobacterium sp.]OIQ16236.1 MAG: molecular chaperone Hsp20 [Flavobacterium sp. MedPE-SWcel]
MSLVKRNNGNGRDLFPSMMDELLKDWAGGAQVAKNTAPPVNVKELEASYSLSLMVPGWKKESFNIEIDNELLSISAEVKKEKEEGKFTRREFNLSSFKRVFTLPETVNTEEINASYQDGILEITLPKKEEVLPKAKRVIGIS